MQGREKSVDGIYGLGYIRAKYGHLQDNLRYYARRL